MSHFPILAIAPNGAYKKKNDHPAVPLNQKEIVQTAIEAEQAGASLLHLHIRDSEARHSLDPEIYLRTIDAIENQLEDKLIIQITSEAAKRYTPEQQIKTIKAVKPAAVSIALREIIIETSDIPQAQSLFNWCAEQACRAQFILYSEPDLQHYFDYLQQDIIPSAPHSVLFVLGRYTQDGQSSSDDLKPFLRHIERLEVPWMVCAFGATEQRCVVEAARKGGHMRIGFENNLLRSDGTQSADNTHQLIDVRNAARKTGITLADVNKARTILSIA